MKRVQAKTASLKGRSRRSVAGKQSAPRSARTRSLSQRPVAAKADQDKRVVAALTELVEISVEIRELLAQIRDALVEREAAEPAEVDTVVIAEAEGPQPPDDEL
jgi:hypothetical protein